MRDWTIWAVIKAMFAAAAKQPVAATLALYLLPALWTIPSALVQAEFVPLEAPVLGPGRPLRAVAVSWATWAWSCIWFAGQLSAAIDIVQGRKIHWPAFISGLKTAPALFLTGMLATLPLDLFNVLPLTPDTTFWYLASAVVCVGVIYVVARTSLWPPLLVGGQTFWSGLAISWKATRGRSFRLLGLAFVLCALALPILVIEALLSTKYFHVTFSTIGAFYLLAVAQLYSFASAAAAPVTAESVVRNPT